MKTFLVLILFSICVSGSGQVSESKQLAADIEKLVQLKLILDNMIKGYSVLSKGYTTISNISQSNFNLHKEYLDALMTVSAIVANDKRIPGIVTAQARIVQAYSSAWKIIVNSSFIKPDELQQLKTRLIELVDESMQALEELYMVISSGKLRMSDAERLAAIGILDADMGKTLLSIRQLSSQVRALVSERNQAAKDANQLKSLYGTRN